MIILVKVIGIYSIHGFTSACCSPLSANPDLGVGHFFHSGVCTLIFVAINDVKSTALINANSVTVCWNINCFANKHLILHLLRLTQDITQKPWK